MASQAPIKVSEQTKERIRYLAALTDVTQAEIVDRAVGEYATRHATRSQPGLSAPGWCSPAVTLLSLPISSVCRPRTSGASPADLARASAGPA